MTAGDSGRGKRAPLTRDRVLSAAVVLAGEAGLDALTMRRLGAHLGVEAMSLYKHVAGKDDILDGIVDIVIGEIELPPANPDWKVTMRTRAESARRVLVAHPWAIGMMESRIAPGPAALRYIDAVIGSLRTAGFSIGMAAHAFVLLDSYIYGFVVQEISAPLGADEHASERSSAASGATLAASYPHLAEMAASHAAGPGYRYEQQFEFGLELILDGLEAHRG